jgi:hypothetical protein
MAVTGGTPESSQNCFYCGGPVTHSELPRKSWPDTVVPFQITEDQALTQLDKWLDKQKLADASVLGDKLRLRLEPHYFAYSMVDADVAVRVKGYTSSQFRSSRSLAPEVGLDMDARVHVSGIGVPLAPKKSGHRLLEHLEPWDLTGEQPFEMECLDGATASTGKRINREPIEWDLDEPTWEPIYGFMPIEPSATDEEATKAAFGALASHVFQEVERSETTRLWGVPHITYQPARIVLLPAWVAYRPGPEDGPFLVAVNGVTGKVTGQLPLRQTKFRVKTVLTFLIGLAMTIGGVAAIVAGVMS